MLTMGMHLSYGSGLTRAEGAVAVREQTQQTRQEPRLKIAFSRRTLSARPYYPRPLGQISFLSAPLLARS
jgi:hypothetical protein